MDERAAAAADGNLEQMVDRDLELHRAIAVASHNPVLSDLYDNLIEALAENIRFNFMHLSHEDDNHADLINAIIAGDGQAAGRAVSVYFAPMLESTSPEGAPEPE